MNVLFAEYREISEMLMNSSDEQRVLLVEVAEDWDQIDDILDNKLNPRISKRNYRSMEKLKAAANVEADVAELALWLATYLQNPRVDHRDRISASAEETRANLARLGALPLTAEKRQLVREIETVLASAMSLVARIIELNDLALEKEKRFIELRDRMDDVLDDEIQATVTANLAAAKADAEQTVFSLRVASIALLFIGLTISAVAMFVMVRNSRQLESTNRDLKTEIVERERSERNLSESRQQLRALTGRLQTVREEERIAIARKIHDEMGQLSTAMIIDLSWMQKEMPAGKLADRVDSLMKLSDEMLATARRIASELRTGLLDEFGLPAAVEHQTEEFQRRTGVTCDLVINMEASHFDPAHSAAAYYIFQEAMTNVARHADASNVNIVLEEADDQVILQIEDNGKGVTLDNLRGTKSLGIVGMRERAEILGGDVKIKSIVGKGTSVTARIPRVTL